MTGFFLLLTSFFVLTGNTTVDLHLHDTYFVIADSHFFWLLAILAVVVWTIYLLTSKLLYSKALTWIHVVITLLTILLFALTPFFGNNLINPTSGGYYDYNIWSSFDSYTRFFKTVTITILVLLFGQIIFVINLIAGLFKRLTNRKT